MEDEHPVLDRLNRNHSRARFDEPKCDRIPLVHPDLEVALTHQWLISPTIRLSTRPECWVPVDRPTANRDRIEWWIDEWLGLNWALELTASAIMALQIEPEIASQSLQELTRGKRDWQKTLHFSVGDSQCFLFKNTENLRSLTGFEGIRYLTGTLQIPPSRTFKGLMAFSDPNAPVLPAPNWLQFVF